MVSAAMVKELREKTGAGMMDCKKVLTETDGDLEKATELLRERGIAKAAKKSGRIAAEGLVETYITEDGKVGAVVEVNSETDFVAKNEEFKSFVSDVAKQVAIKNPETVEALLAEESISVSGKTVQEVLIEEVNAAQEGYLTGRMSQNLLVHFPGDPHLIGKLLPVRLNEYKGFYYIGEQVECHYHQ